MTAEISEKELKGVGDKNAALLAKLGICTVRDLLEYYPRAYDIFGLPENIEELREGTVAAVESIVPARPSVVKTPRYLIVSMNASDPTGNINLVCYNTPFIASQLKTGMRYVFRGRVIRKRNELILTQPVIFTREAYIRKLSELQPVYPLTKGVTNNLLLKLMKEALTLVRADEDPLPSAARKQYDLIKYKDALQNIHFPLSKENCIDAHKRLAFDEFVRFSALVRTMKENRKIEVNNYRVTDFSVCEQLIKSLPYKLTGAQQKVYREICHDLSSDTLMSRMIQGDVGSGKTVVAMLAILACVKQGYQACIMAPTDVLAKQHYEDFTKQLAPFGIKVELLTGALTAAQKRKAHESIKAHECDVIVGTHALIQDSVEYDKLALAVIDEQHRFGVNQREAIREKGDHPHILAMSATPIPRSLAIILYGDLDLSIIDEMPANRLPIKNCVVGTGYRPTAYNFIKKQIDEGHQAYVICPMVEESEMTEAENVIDYTDSMRAAVADDHINIEFLHGKMKPAEKNAIMNDFSSGKIDVLVSTTVVEVGVNVPNATVMMVENAERFGLAQLHQLRGRVGRGSAQSYCIFIKGSDSKEIDERLDILVKYRDGMQVAENDLRLRGPGDFFGTRQSGELVFKIADIYSDADVLKAATEYAGSMTREELLCFSRTQTNNWII